MRVFFIALVLLVLWTYTEVTLLLFVARQTNILVALLLTIVTGAIGVALARRQGWQLMSRVRQELARGEVPVDQLLSGALLFIAGILLVIPGMISDVAGLLLLIPPLRHLLARRLKNRIQGRLQRGRSWLTNRARGGYTSQGDVVDSYQVPPPADKHIGP